MITFTSKRGNVAIVTERLSLDQKRLVVDIEWATPPSRKDLKDFKQWWTENTGEEPAAIVVIEDEAERKAAGANYLTSGKMP